MDETRIRRPNWARLTDEELENIAIKHGGWTAERLADSHAEWHDQNLWHSNIKFALSKVLNQLFWTGVIDLNTRSAWNDPDVVFEETVG